VKTLDRALPWLTVLAVAVTGIGVAQALLAPDSARFWPWALGRVAGLLAYAMLWLAVLLGIWQSHPWGRGRPLVIPRLHTLLIEWTAGLVFVHVTALALDPYAGVGYAGAFLPGVSAYRPWAVAIGIVAVYAGLVIALTAWLGPKMGKGFWLPLHRWSVAVLAAVWLHGVLAGSDTPQLFAFYIATGLVVMVLGASRYLAPTGARAAPVAKRGV
jgi:hypothetical protein